MIIKAYKLASMVACVAVITGWTASSAAATPIEVTNSQQQHCPGLVFVGDTVLGGCVAHLVSVDKVEYGFYLTGSPLWLYKCDTEMTLRMDEDGNAAITNVAMTNCNGVGARPCGNTEAHAGVPNGGEVPWRSPEAAEETAANVVSLPINVCFRMPLSPGEFDCEGINTFAIDTSASPYTATSSIGGFISPPGNRCFMKGTWEFEDTGTLVITHL